MKTTSAFLHLNWRDLVNGLLVTSLSAPVFIILSSIMQGHFNLDWVGLGKTALSSAAGYLLKNLFTDNKIDAPTSLAAK